MIEKVTLVSAVVISIHMLSASAQHGPETPYPSDPNPWGPIVMDTSVARFGYPQNGNPGMPKKMASAWTEWPEMASAFLAAGATYTEALDVPAGDSYRTRCVTAGGCIEPSAPFGPDASVARFGYPQNGNPGMPKKMASAWTEWPEMASAFLAAGATYTEALDVPAGDSYHTRCVTAGGCIEPSAPFGPDASVARFGYPQNGNPGMPKKMASAWTEWPEMASAFLAAGATYTEALDVPAGDSYHTRCVTAGGCIEPSAPFGPDASVARFGYPQNGNPGMPKKMASAWTEWPEMVSAWTAQSVAAGVLSMVAITPSGELPPPDPLNPFPPAPIGPKTPMVATFMSAGTSSNEWQFPSLRVELDRLARVTCCIRIGPFPPNPVEPPKPPMAWVVHYP